MGKTRGFISLGAYLQCTRSRCYGSILPDFCKALMFHLQASPFWAPELMPFSPFVDCEATIQASRITVTELRKHLGI